MHTVVDPIEAESVAMATTKTPATITTTLYDLLTAMQSVVGPDDDTLVVATVRHMLRSGRATWCCDNGVGVN
jgi:hypothetical protein